MAKTSDTVEEFLTNLTRKLLPAAAKELEALR
jgi:Zn-dependent oligopeptidase